MGITVRVNGSSHLLPDDVPGSTALMHVLRGDLGLAGVRAGCSIGECGSCTVLVDGEAARSCLTPIEAVVGSEVTTPEGLFGEGAGSHPVQQAFLNEQAAQCGFCINGMMMTVAAACEASERVDGPELLRRLDEHLCRCGTYDRIRRAALSALGEPLPPSDRHGPSEVVVDGATEDDAIGTLPAALTADRALGSWLRLAPDGTVVLSTGRVELGQGVLMALSAIAAANLGVDPEVIRIAPTSTGGAPDEGYTAGSRSMEDGGRAVAMAAVALRRLLLTAAAKVLGSGPEELEVSGQAVVHRTDRSRRVALDALVEMVPADARIEDTDHPRWDVVEDRGTGLARDDLAVKLSGSPAYVHDLVLPGMLHARPLLPPRLGARAEGLDLEGAEQVPGVTAVIRHGAIHVVVAEREDAAIRGINRLSRSVRWVGGELESTDLEATLRSEPSERYTAAEHGDVEAALATGTSIGRRTYVKAFQAHGAIAPSAAVAVQDGDLLRVWSHSQGINPLRRELATLLATPVERIEVIHAAGPGCYGFNGADDAAALAAITARAFPSRPVRLRFSVTDEFLWEPLGPAMLSDLEGALDADGDVIAWSHRTISGIHSMRPDGSGDRLLAAWLADDPVPVPFLGAQESGGRNGAPPYSFPNVAAYADHVRQPLRTGALRTLGSQHNVFAAESFMDELAEAAGRDPVEFRLAHLEDERLSQVLRLAAERVDWKPRIGPSGAGRGVAVVRYKDVAAYVALVADVSVDGEDASFTVDRLTAVCDAGTVVDEVGLRNQLEGGLLQGLSRTLHEGVGLTRDGRGARDWSEYPSLRMLGTPEIDLVLVRGAGGRPLGAGEATTPAVAPAVANALDDAIGVRLRTLPFGPDALMRRLLELDEAETARVIVPG